MVRASEKITSTKSSQDLISQFKKPFIKKSQSLKEKHIFKEKYVIVENIKNTNNNAYPFFQK
jgi:hypothetical protein